MRRSFTYLLTTWLVLVAACGYRTAPVPYALPDESIQTVSHAKLNARGDNWVFHWMIPEGQLTDQSSEKDKQPPADATADIPPVKESAISIFRINIFKSTGGCAHCEPKNLGHFIIDLNGDTVEPVFPEGVTLSAKPRLFMTGKEDFHFDLPIAFFRDNGLIERCFYTIDYFLNSDQLSTPSQKLYPPDLKKVPQPKVRVRTSFSSEAQPEFFLILLWDPQQEALRHILQKGGKFSEQVIYYGVNFYSKIEINPSQEQAQKGDTLFMNSEQLINPEPLLYGSFSLLNFQGQLLARQVDRFGNESASVLVFSGQY